MYFNEMGFGNKIMKIVEDRNWNLDQLILNKWPIVLCGHFSFVPRVIIKYKLDCIFIEKSAFFLKKI
jgi:hypothetical protein